jgi:hypothetical protein
LVFPQVRNSSGFTRLHAVAAPVTAAVSGNRPVSPSSPGTGDLQAFLRYFLNDIMRNYWTEPCIL